MHTHDIVIIGGGPAAIAAAKKLGPVFDTALIRKEDHSLIYCAMPYVIEQVLPQQSTRKKDSLVTDSGTTLIRGTAVGIDFEARTVTMQDSSRIGWEKLVVATGADPVIPPIPGAGLRGVTGFKTREDLEYLLSAVEQGLTQAAVIGAGAIGIELALALCRAGVQVDLVEMAGSILPNMIDPDMASLITEEITAAGITLHLGSSVAGLAGTDRVEQLMLTSGESIRIASAGAPYSGVNYESDHLPGVAVFAVGMRAQVELVRGSTMEIGRDGIIVNERMETSIPDVFAVGDCVQFKSGITGNPIPGKLATNAVPMGKVLADNLLGKERSYSGFYNGAATMVGRWFVGGTGLTEQAARAAGFATAVGYSEVTTRFPVMPETLPLKMKIISDASTGRMLGAQIVSGQPVTDRIDLLTFALQTGSTLEDLVQLSYSAQPYQSFFPAANGIVLAAEDALKRRG